MNKYIALGNLTKDPVFKNTKNGNKVCDFSIAINNKLSNSVFFIDVESWGNIAENCNRFLVKGRKVLIEGKLMSSNWTSKNGEQRSRVYCRADFINFLDKSENETKQKTTQQKVAEQKAQEIIEEDEFADIPF
jgi:single-strand DNA-binding protein